MLVPISVFCDSLTDYTISIEQDTAVVFDDTAITTQTDVEQCLLDSKVMVSCDHNTII